MASSAGNQRIIPLDEGWNDEIKAKVRQAEAITTNNHQPQQNP